ncbi:unnamed protein product [Kuraishia capsulata CBS 1993]|uniref:Indoleamine 2,3-dioxygenase n=1 Tax=Kuraishia capsulata CBS 1993 TaxID=1382522 RepID=W6MW99_9ASCO|nr:uncharacterized protein KUCA_T00003052001 [Kuraishia capsulata CBS 1993]CDK27075.1 unnamed protein product [Kuraishia capsulata CBS 1993]
MRSNIPLPCLEDYDVSAITGFLPHEVPLQRLTNPYYAQWEEIAAAVPSLLLTRRIRSVVDAKLKLLSCEYLGSKAEWRRAYSVLGFIAHAYIWSVGDSTNKLPAQIARPFLETAEKLDLPAVATYAGLCLWNYKLIFNDEESLEHLDLDNITTINTFTGSIDESWFYLVSVYFEYKGAPCIVKGLDAIQYAREGNIAKVVETLQSLAEAIDELGSVLMRMEEMCDPHVFYFKIRPYLAGWKNMESVGLKNGVYYGDEVEPRLYAGGSNAQSSLIQTLDLILNVEHFGTGDSKGHDQNAFMSEMRSYMPGAHKRFLEHLSKVNIIKEFVTENAPQNPELVLSYDACIAMLKAFRDKHIQIVTRYIILQSQKSKTMGSDTTKTIRSGLAKSTHKKEDMRGTGGTALLPFLKQCRDETGDAAAGRWGRRILTGALTSKPSRSAMLESEFEDTKIGMAGSWKDDRSNVREGHW